MVRVQPVKVTVKSKLPEFAGLRIWNKEVSPEMTWEDFFRLLGVTAFNSQVHVIKTNRNDSAFGNDLIQDTASRFIRRSFQVHIRKAMRAVGRTTLRHEPQRSLLDDSNATVLNSRGREANIRIRGSSILSDGSQAAVIDLGPILQGSSGGGSSGGRRSSFLEGDTASQDSQDADEDISSMKDRFLTIAGRLSNSNFAQFREELRTLHSDPVRGLRWANKTPKIANFLSMALLHEQSN